MQAQGLSKFTVRTSDRRVFRRCLRKWDFQSSLRQNLTRAGSEQNINFWFGSGIHFCLEDYHGENRFEDPRRAYYAYHNAFPDDERPMGAENHYNLAMSMLTYYLTWMPRHNEQTGFETVWRMPDTYIPVPRGTPGAIPMDEISFITPLGVWAIVDIAEERIVGSIWTDPQTGELSGDLLSGWDPHNPDQEYLFQNRVVKCIEIFYHGTIDRIVQDKYGRYWLWDYKTAKSADTAKLATDDQVSAYLWAARKLFPFKIYGFVYLQLTKTKAVAPKRLKSGELSCDKRQSTTYSLYREALIEDYGEVNKAPSKMIETLNHLAANEQPEGDKFIRWDFVKRNDAQLDATERAIYGELRIMLDPNLYCYPSPTRDCSWDCPFRDACIAMDSGDQFGYDEVLRGYEQRPHNQDGNIEEWRKNIQWTLEDGTLVPIEDVLEFDSGMLPEFNFEETEDGFKFLYEDDNC